MGHVSFRLHTEWKWDSRITNLNARLEYKSKGKEKGNGTNSKVTINVYSSVQ